MRTRRPYRTILIVVGFLLFVGAASFATFGMRGNGTVSAFLPAPYTIEEAITVQSKTVDGTTTYWGQFPLKSMCGTISTGIATLETGTPRVTLLFTVLEPVEGCDVPGTAYQDFSASYTPIGSNKDKTPEFEGVTINGVIAKYTLVEDGAEEEE